MFSQERQATSDLGCTLEGASAWKRSLIEVKFRGRHQGLQASVEDWGKWLPDPIISMEFPCTIDNNLRSALEPFTTPAIVTVRILVVHSSIRSGYDAIVGPSLPGRVSREQKCTGTKIFPYIFIF